MRFLTDENLFEPIVEYLRDLGHDVLNIRDNLSGIKDDEVYKIACEQNRIIITMDKDFSKIFRFHPKYCGGIIVVKIYRHTIKETCEIFKKFFIMLKEKDIFGNLIVISPNGIRIKRFHEEIE
ncbi:MAG: DUF5615 family PIN-like protein [Thermodesulfovibrio sp.]|uniref:DUF5615 family PIN-like protein n=1 Tax=Thermodesulfovibrio sp. N1 TaxID=1871110 RepID=UPI00083A400A|nr:DUF5615 family PIN-like protein [Thermodesulfovibrio sp. N1]MDI6713935.1 DUF5615 family PIN-like protein [Thermodesulfovibrio sp.]ODA44349.1 hypothetical protein THER_0895 [Thermodesulfovibrio sp. N1]